MEIGILFLLLAICASILFFECTKAGEKLIEYLYNKFMK